MPQKHFELLKIVSVCLKFFIIHKDNIIFLSYDKKKSGLLKNFRIAMLPCCRGFPLSAHPPLRCKLFDIYFYFLYICKKKNLIKCKLWG